MAKKKKDIEEVKDYLDNLDSCQMCGEMKGLIEDYTESYFVPLAVSAGNSLNMYWDMDVNLGICDVCKLMLFCTPAGATLVRKKYLQNEDNGSKLLRIRKQLLETIEPTATMCFINSTIA